MNSANARVNESNDRVSETELERLVEGQLSDREYRRVVEQLGQEPDGWRRCCLAFLEHQALRADLGLLGNFPFDAQTGSQDDRDLLDASADEILRGDVEDWSERFPRPIARSNRPGRRSSWLRGWLQSPLQNPLGGFAVVVAASVLVYAAVNAGRDRLRQPEGLSLEPSRRPGVEEDVGYADYATPKTVQSVDAEGQSSPAGAPINERIQFAVVRSDEDPANTLSVPLEQAGPSDSLRWPSRSAAGAADGLNSSLKGMAKPYRVQPRLFLSVRPNGQLALIPVEVIRIKAYQ